MKIKCKKCGSINNVNVGSLIRSVNSAKQKLASKLNGAKGGRPRKPKKESR